jgi:hypothetical protein
MQDSGKGMPNGKGTPMRAVSVVAAALVLALVCSCGLSDAYNLLRCSFRVEATEDFVMAGIPLDGLDSLSGEQLVTALSCWENGSFPVDFTLEVGIRNPNEGSSSGPSIPAELTRFDFDLYLDTSGDGSVDTTRVLSGGLGAPLVVPEGGETEILPLELSLDAFALLSELGPMAVIDLALAIGGIDSDLRDPLHLGRVYVRAVPEFDTPLGEITYPTAVTINLDWTDGSD